MFEKIYKQHIQTSDNATEKQPYTAIINEQLLTIYLDSSNYFSLSNLILFAVQFKSLKTGHCLHKFQALFFCVTLFLNEP